MIESKNIFFSYFNNEEFKNNAKAADCEIEFAEFLNYLNENFVYVGRSGKGEKSFGNLDILGKISELFVAKFQLYGKEFEEIKRDLENAGISLKLDAELIDKKACYEFSNVVIKLYKKYDSLLEIDYALQQSLNQFNKEFGNKNVSPFDLNKWKQAVSFLKLLSDITFTLSNVKDTNIFYSSDDNGKKITINDNQPINWCSYCFRRSSNKRPQRYSQVEYTKKKYNLTCRIHNSSNDKIYREAKSRAKLLSEVDRQYINQIHAERISYELHNSQSEVEFVTYEQWQKFGDSWIDALQKVFPNEDLTQIINWNQYVTKFHLLFENYEETTTNPRYIMDIFIEAEIWSNLEKNNPKIDRRRKLTE